jgi:ABC-type multidrug transport system permease subunit
MPGAVVMSLGAGVCQGKVKMSGCQQSRNVRFGLFQVLLLTCGFGFFLWLFKIVAATAESLPGSAN